MDRSNRRTVALVATAVVVTFLLCRAAPLTARTQGALSYWVKVGPHFINGNAINHVLDRGAVLDVYVGDGDQNHGIHLQGPDVEPMRRWLDVRADPPLERFRGDRSTPEKRDQAPLVPRLSQSRTALS